MREVLLSRDTFTKDGEGLFYRLTNMVQITHLNGEL